MAIENYFALFDLPVRYGLDLAALKQRYMQRSRALHPDHHTQASPAMQAEALRLSALTNQAYKTLLNEQLRLEHMLHLAGLLQTSEASQQTLPPAFLMQMMELNEEIEQLQQGGAQATALQATVAGMLHNLDTQIATAMASHDATTMDADRLGSLQTALLLHLQRKYVLRMQALLRTFAPL